MIVVSGDAGFCVEEFCNWLNEKGFFYLFRIKENAGNIYLRTVDWAVSIMENNPAGDFFQSFHCEGSENHSRRLWRIKGLQHAVYPGSQEGFVVEKTNLETQKTDLQYFITNRPSMAWEAQDILDRILLHWDTETGVFGIKDNTFHEDKVRYKTIAGVMGHVSLLNIAWNGLSAPVFKPYWKDRSMNVRMQFWKDRPEYNPFQLNI